MCITPYYRQGKGIFRGVEGKLLFFAYNLQNALNEMVCQPETSFATKPFQRLFQRWYFLLLLRAD